MCAGRPSNSWYAVGGGTIALTSGGGGSKGFIFMMNANGEIDGFLPQGPETGTGQEQEYDVDSLGILTISPFDASRFSSITAIT